MVKVKFKAYGAYHGYTKENKKAVDNQAIVINFLYIGEQSQEVSYSNLCKADAEHED